MSENPPRFYVVTAQSPTTTGLSVVGQFSANDETRMLVLARGNRLVSFVIHPAGIDCIAEETLYGRIEALELLRPEGKSFDALFICTDRHDCCLLHWNHAHRQWTTAWSGNASESVGRLRDTGYLACVDPRGRAVALQTHQGLIKVFPLSHSADPIVQRARKVTVKGKEAKFKALPIGEMGEAMSFRIEELNVIAMAFLDTEKPTLALIYQDSFKRRHLKTYEVPSSAQAEMRPELIATAWRVPDISETASRLLPLAQRGLIVAGDKKICVSLFDQNGSSHRSESLVIAASGLVAAARVDDTRYVFGDTKGKLALLTLNPAANKVQLEWSEMGMTSIPSCLAYVGNGMVFVGSHFGDSAVVQMPTDMSAMDGSVALRELEVFTNIAPITDFEVVDFDKQGQGQMVTCSGAYNNGSLRVIRSGVGIHELGNLDMAEVENIWSLKSSSDATEERYLVLGFIGETRVIFLNDEGELEELEFSGLPVDTPTVFVTNVIGDQWFHVTPNEVRLVSAKYGRPLATWRPSSNQKIYGATAAKDQALIACGNGLLVSLQIGDGKLRQQGQKIMDHEVASISIHPDMPTLCAVSLWQDITVRLLSLPDFQELDRDALGGDVVVRSLAFAHFGEEDYLLATLGDGQLFHYVLNRASHRLHDRKRIIVGTQPIHLASFDNLSSERMIFASSDRPCIIHASGKKIAYSPVDLKNVKRVTTFKTALYGNALALVNTSGIILGRIDEVRKLHIRTIKLGEQARRISAQEYSRTFGVITLQHVPDGSQRSFFRLLDDQSFEVLDSYQLGNTEFVQSIASVKFANTVRPYYVVGTAFVSPEEEEPKKGRILVFSVSEARQAQLVTKFDVKGSVFALSGYQGMLLCCVNSRVQLFRLAKEEGLELALVCSHHGQIMALALDTCRDVIAVGDLMKSVTLLRYDPVEEKLNEIARDFNTNWMTAVHALDEEIFMGAENGCNLFCLRRHHDEASEDKRRWLETVATFHTGEFINRFRAGTLMQYHSGYDLMSDETPIAKPRLLFGTVSGMIGIIAQLKPEAYDQLALLQHNLRHMLKSVGKFDHKAYRDFANDRRSVESAGIIDGDLIERFLELPADRMQDAVLGRNVKDGKSLTLAVAQVQSMVEDLARLH